MSFKTLIDLSGQKYGRLTVLKRGMNDNSGKVRWICKCDCGNEKLLRSNDIRSGKIVSCGCYMKEVVRNISITHNMSHTRPYTIWGLIKARTLNDNAQSYKYYRGRGIKICDKWLTFEGFWEDMQEGYSDELSIDRIDVNGNYEKSNCRWATNKEQQNNTRRNRKIEYNGEVKNVGQWSKIIGISVNTLRKRLNNGWNVNDTFNMNPSHQLYRNRKTQSMGGQPNGNQMQGM